MKNNLLDSIKNLITDKVVEFKDIFGYILEDQNISYNKNADQLKDIDYCLVNSSDLASAVNCKKDSLAERFFEYKNVSLSNNSLNILMFMNKESIMEIENVISKLDRKSVV